MNAEERAIDLTGGSAENLAEALDQWENERQALMELHDENQALAFAFRRYDLTMKLAAQIIAAIEADADMFITQKTRNKIELFRDQMQKLENSRTQDRELVQNTNERIRQRREKQNVSPNANP